ncbi:uncharacterized protein LOC129757191 [Uranotaenia lowii]|uniref:uncharacterized protein LOC129757191 n=1 Tax=Uranotaenia lowii TaxID=190385 RepID=UPI00247A4704|nr:uncharacterized protein LOC129757191 [Uranotaenia lowii]
MRLLVETLRGKSTKMLRLRMIRFSRFKLLLLLILCVAFYFLARWQIVSHSKSSESRFLHTCNVSDSYRIELERLFERVHNILEEQQIIHFLCYGTLWGQIRMGRLLPWRKKADFCVLNEELVTREEARFLRYFINQDLQIYYVHSEGVYRIFVDDPETGPYVELIVFQRDDMQSMYKRIGWKRRLMPPHCDWTPSLDCFPVHLLQIPLPQRRLGQHIYSVPMGGIEIQKYHYSENWWKDIRVFNC